MAGIEAIYNRHLVVGISYPQYLSFLITILVWLLFLIQNLIPETYRTPILYWSGQGLTAVILGAIPAIGLCTLKRNLHRKTEVSP